MSRPALAATRSAAMLNFLAANPSEGFTLSDLAERLGHQRGVDARAARRPHRRRLPRAPPAPAHLHPRPVGRRARHRRARDAPRHRPRPRRRPRPRPRDRPRGRRHARSPATTSSSWPAPATRRPRAVPVHVGQHVPFVPPLGSVFVAWGDAESWLAQSRRRRRAPPRPRRRAPTAATRSRSKPTPASASATRSTTSPPTRPTTAHATRSTRSSPSSRNATTSCATSIRPGTYDVSMIAAPIFGPAGEVALAFTLLGFGAGLPGARDRRLRRAPPRHRPRHHQTHPRPRPRHPPHASTNFRPATSRILCGVVRGR